MTSSHLTRVLRFSFIAALCAVGLPIAVGGTAQAQSRDVQPLLDRLDRLERDMNMLQRQVYRPGPNGAPVSVSPPDPQAALSNEVRMGQIEDQMRTLTGQVEEFNYNLDQLKRRLDTLSSDLDLRLSQLEHGGGAGAAAIPPPPPPGPTGGPPPAPGRGAGANPGEPPSQSGILGKIPVGASDGSSPPPQQAAAPATSGALPGGSPQDQYNYAFGLLRRADYPSAEQALKSFVQRYPNDALAGNAQYWLGETYYVRKDYNNAAVAFAEGYQKYPKGAKAADDLLKLGMALGNLGQKADACRAFARLDRDFPSAPGNIKDRQTSEKQRLAC